ELPAGLPRDAGMSGRIATDLHPPVPDGDRLDPAAALHDLLLDIRAGGGEVQLPLLLRAHSRLRHLDLFRAQAVLRGEAERDLVVERDVERIRAQLRAVRAARRRHDSERAVA